MTKWQKAAWAVTLSAIALTLWIGVRAGRGDLEAISSEPVSVSTPVANNGGTTAPTLVKRTLPPATVATTTSLVPSPTSTPLDEPSLTTAPVTTTSTQPPKPAGHLNPEADQLRDLIELGSPEWVGVMTKNGSDAEIDRFANVTGRQPDIVQVAIGWESDQFDSELVNRISRRGSVLMISWEPWDHRQSVDPAEQPKYALQNILNGDFDTYIDEWANGLAADGRPVLLRFAHEMNGVWYPWAEGVNANAPGSYVATWRYVQDRFAAAGADNVIWVWSPNVSYIGAPPLAPLYPGADRVDLLGLVGYFGHFNKVPDEFPAFGELFGPTLSEMATIDASPVLITETGSTEEGGYKPAWTADFLANVGDRDHVVGFVWFDVDKEADWGISSSQAAEDAFVAGISEPAYLGG